MSHDITIDEQMLNLLATNKELWYALRNSHKEIEILEREIKTLNAILKRLDKGWTDIKRF